MEILLALVGLVIGLAIGAGGLLVYQKQQATGLIHEAQQEAKRLLNEAETNAKQIIIDAKNESLKLQEEMERLQQKRRTELENEEERLAKRRAELDRRFDRIEQREKELNKRQSTIDRRKNEIDQLWETRMSELERIAQLTQAEARAELLAAVEEEAHNDMIRILRETEARIREEADERARDIIALSIQRLASEHVNEIAVAVVPLPSDDMKGRIIGRAGRNIRTFEQVAGVDVVVDDTPEAVTISSFDPIRREIARRALSKLVMDGRIHPARIEKLVADTSKEVERIIIEEGERACYETGVTGLHPEIIKTLGRLKFRMSYGQNQHAHAIETAHLAGMIAAELGADVEVAKAGGLLHDIGKALSHEIEGPHAIVGAEFCARYGISGKVRNCIESHHHEVPQECVEALIVEAADAISGARPGARRESLDAYVRRVRMLEEIANSFEGVEQAFALQAGREVRIMVRPDDIDDLKAAQLARAISKKIEESMQYPGQIKVTIIRETRVVEYAK
ncbi:MAG: ribonuclease Y [Phototrophicales bacterium]|nr:MAG: ribonuclease Y [Phototrophicales bacterium]